jgi:phosphatidylethanolamine-binding protein (PEBP) family uncharacterized protein
MIQYLILAIILILVLAMYWSTAVYGDLEKFEVIYDETPLRGVPRLNKKNTLKPPYIKFPGADINALYTIIMVDPDAPKTLEDHAFRHFMSVDVSGSKLQNGIRNIEGSGRLLTPYMPPSPPPGSGIHNYQIRLYLQRKGRWNENPISDQRTNWPLEYEAKKSNLYEVARRTFTIAS